MELKRQTIFKNNLAFMWNFTVFTNNALMKIAIREIKIIRIKLI